MATPPRKKPGQRTDLALPAPNLKHLKLDSVVTYTNENCPENLALLPRPDQVHIADQLGDKGSSKVRLGVGYFKVNHKLVPVWAHMTTPCHVESRYGVNTTVSREQRDNFKIFAPFSHVGKETRLKPFILDFLIVYCPMEARHWDTFVNGKGNNISLRGLGKACQEIANAVCGF